MSMSNPNLVVIPSEIEGRGVISTDFIQAGEIIEICPVIIVPKQEVKLIHQTTLHDYYFNWKNGKCAICLGLGSIYNHARQPNADYKMDYENRTIDFYSIRPIAAGEEITVSYLHSNKKEGELWFEVN